MIAILLAAQLAAASPVTAHADSVMRPPQQGRPRAVEVSDWYARRLIVHRTLSYALVPMFGFQWAAGRQIWEKGNAAPAWARKGHQIGAASIATAFTVNAVTGAWNLWDSRDASEGRARRYLHAASMLAASAGFTYAGAVLSEQAERDLDKRKQHKIVALSSMGLTVASGLLMKFLND